MRQWRGPHVKTGELSEMPNGRLENETIVLCVLVSGHAVCCRDGASTGW